MQRFHRKGTYSNNGHNNSSQQGREAVLARINKLGNKKEVNRRIFFQFIQQTQPFFLLKIFYLKAIMTRADIFSLWAEIIILKNGFRRNNFRSPGTISLAGCFDGFVDITGWIWFPMVFQDI